MPIVCAALFLPAQNPFKMWRFDGEDKPDEALA